MAWSFAMQDTGRKAHIESLTNQRHFRAAYWRLTARFIKSQLEELT